MADLFNLKRERKKRDRRQSESEAAANRLNFGTPSAPRAKAEAARRRDEAVLDGKRRDDAADDAGPDARGD